MAGKPIYAALQAVQRELKAPKGQYNSFGKYKYRSCEDIVEAVKPLLNEHGLILTMSDDVVEFGNYAHKKTTGNDVVEISGSRIYIKATATVIDVVTGDKIEVTAMAREPEEKKGMDCSQITGTASSYARKYALNGLFAIDDTKDADTDQYKQQTNGSNSSQNRPQATQKQNAGTYKGSTANNATDEMRAKAIKSLNAEIERTGVASSEVAAIAKAKYGKASVKEMTTGQICDLANKLESYLMEQINEASA
jgi:hypothetical protein